MFHVDNRTTVLNKPVKNVVYDVRRQWFNDKIGQVPTTPQADWFNMIQSEFLNVLDVAGVIPDKNNDKQLALAMQNISFQSEWDKMMFGTPYPTLLSAPPEANILFANGQVFDKVKYPKLAALFPSGKLPDLQDRVLLGASATYTVGNVVAQTLLKHTHSGSVGNAAAIKGTGTTNAGGGHVHTAWTDVAGSHIHGAWMGGAGGHGHTAWTDAAPDHQHSQGVAAAIVAGGGEFWMNYATQSSNFTGWAGGHAHDIGIGYCENHIHGVGVSAIADHTHSFSVDMPIHGHTMTVNSVGDDINRVNSYTVNYMFKAA